MYTKLEILWEALEAARGAVARREELIGESRKLFSINEIISFVKDDDAFREKLNEHIKTPTPSDTAKNTPPWVREFRNLNSNGVFERYGLVEDIPFFVRAGLELTERGLNITKKQLSSLMGPAGY